MRKKKNRITRNLTQRIKLHVHALNKVEVWFCVCLRGQEDLRPKGKCIKKSKLWSKKNYAKPKGS